MPGLHALIDVRVLRLLRLFRILKLTEYVREFGALARALRAAGARSGLPGVRDAGGLIMGTLMYVVEGPANGYTSIPVGGVLGDHDDDDRRLRRHHAARPTSDA